jgi:predicted NUDIX family phosphoesterase
MTPRTTVQQPSSSLHEEILVVKRTHLFNDLYRPWQGIKTSDTHQFLTAIHNHQEFHVRASMEQDPTYKQIIPYVIFTHENRYFLMQRSKKASEKRLQSNWTLGIGGHVRKEDMTGSSLFSLAKREFHEEVSYAGTVDIELIGLLNDDTNEVGKVHMGIILHARGDSPHIKIKSELARGSLLSLDECMTFYKHMESWSQTIMDLLRQSC